MSRITALSLMSAVKYGWPFFHTRHSVGAVAVHAAFLAVGYELVQSGPETFSDRDIASSIAGSAGFCDDNMVKVCYRHRYHMPGSDDVFVKCIAGEYDMMITAMNVVNKNCFFYDVKVNDYMDDLDGNLDRKVENVKGLMIRVKERIHWHLVVRDAGPSRSRKKSAGSPRDFPEEVFYLPPGAIPEPLGDVKLPPIVYNFALPGRAKDFLLKHFGNQTRGRICLRTRFQPQGEQLDAYLSAKKMHLTSPWADIQAENQYSSRVYVWGYVDPNSDDICLVFDSLEDEETDPAIDAGSG